MASSFNKVKIRRWILLLVICTNPYGFAQTWSILDPFPNSDPYTTIYTGLSGNNFVGYYSLNGSVRGFLKNNNTWLNIITPEGNNFLPEGIDESNIIGSVSTANGTQSYVFNLANNSWSQIVNTNAQGVFAYGISGNKIVGELSFQVGSNKGFIFDGNSWTILSPPFGLNQSDYSTANDIDGNFVVGSYGNGTFIYNNGAYQKIGNIANATWNTQKVAGIFNSKTIGSYIDSNGGNERGYIFEGSTFLNIDAFDNNQNATRLRDISDDKILGYYWDVNSSGNFLYTIPEPSALSLLAVGLGGLAMMRRRRS